MLLYRKPKPQTKIKKRKEGFFPAPGDTKTLFFASLRGTLTVEAAMVLPLFLFCMISALQYCIVMETATKYGAALSDAGKTIATVAYATTYIDDSGTAAQLAEQVLSVAYAQLSVDRKVGDTSAVKAENMALSRVMDEDDMIDLKLTYQIKSPVSLIRLPWRPFIQRACVRAWVGRAGAGSKETEESETDEEIVYVTETGSVYHRDLNCTYLNLKISEISAEQVESARNNGGARYYPCERCGDSCGSIVYITAEGTRYHSSMQCSSLKRTVGEKKLSEVGDLHACSRCG